MSTLARDGATCATVLKTACIGAELPMMLLEAVLLGEARAQQARLARSRRAAISRVDARRTARRR